MEHPTSIPAVDCFLGMKAARAAGSSKGAKKSPRGKQGKQDTILGIDEEELKKAVSEGKGSSIVIDDDELDAAFAFFDVDGKGKLTPQDLKVRLSAFYKNLPAKEYKTLISEPNFTKDTLKKLLENNELGNYDPVKEAFKVYDPEGTGFVNLEVLKGIFENLGHGEITSEDLDVLVETADVDGDGKISLEDFRNMLGHNKAKLKEAEPQQGEQGE